MNSTTYNSQPLIECRTDDVVFLNLSCFRKENVINSWFTETRYCFFSYRLCENHQNKGFASFTVYVTPIEVSVLIEWSVQ